MQVIRYNLIAKINTGTEGEPIWEESKGYAVTMGYSERNLEIAKAEAWQGEVEIVDDGEPEPEETVSDSERIAELEEALEMLLSGVTE